MFPLEYRIHPGPGHSTTPVAFLSVTRFQKRNIRNTIRMGYHDEQNRNRISIRYIIWNKNYIPSRHLPAQKNPGNVKYVQN